MHRLLCMKYHNRGYFVENWERKKQIFKLHPWAHPLALPVSQLSTIDSDFSSNSPFPVSIHGSVCVSRLSFVSRRSTSGDVRRQFWTLIVLPSVPAPYSAPAPAQVVPWRPAHFSRRWRHSLRRLGVGVGAVELADLRHFSVSLLCTLFSAKTKVKEDDSWAFVLWLLIKGYWYMIKINKACKYRDNASPPVLFMARYTINIHTLWLLGSILYPGECDLTVYPRKYSVIFSRMHFVTFIYVYNNVMLCYIILYYIIL